MVEIPVKHSSLFNKYIYMYKVNGQSVLSSFVSTVLSKILIFSLIFLSENEEFIVNLIDSPGHVDFSSEASNTLL